jgi:hypothetical protein
MAAVQPATRLLGWSATLGFQPLTPEARAKPPLPGKRQWPESPDRDAQLKWPDLKPLCRLSSGGRSAKPGKRGLKYGPVSQVENQGRWLAGAGGIEPPNVGTKNRCLTTWLRPNCGASYSSAPLAARQKRKGLGRCDVYLYAIQATGMGKSKCKKRTKRIAGRHCR